MARSERTDTTDSPFIVSVYCRVYETRQMADLDWLKPRWDTLSANLRVDKIYMETHRDTIIATDEELTRLKAFFAERGVQTAGGITYTIDESNRFETFCFTDPKERALAREIIEHSARHFDEVILDDFFFTNCKCAQCIAAKGDKSWTQYRLELMRGAARDLILGPAKAVNPNVKVVIKYPNWYEHFPGLGFDLEREPTWFDGIYTGTETRQPFYNHQHLQEYHGYSIVRYFENIAPSRNGGGWVDTGGMREIDRYAEQLWITLFAKAPELTLFDFRQLNYAIKPTGRGAWQGTGTSFDFDAMVAPHVQPDGSYGPDLLVSRAAGVAIEKVRGLIGKLGTPLGVAAYKPYHSLGEDYLHSYLGMLGIPMDVRPTLPDDPTKTVFLNEAAKFDPQIAQKIATRLEAGGSVVITSGLLRALQGKGIEQIVEAVCTDKKVLTQEFYRWRDIYRIDKPLLLPQIEYLTNDAWELIGADANAYPFVLQADYGAGKLNIIALPDNFADLYHLPVPVLNFLRGLIAGEMPVQLDAPARVSLYTYDNGAFVVESFQDTALTIPIKVRGSFRVLRDLETGEVFLGETEAESTVFTVPVPAHSYRGFLPEAE